MFSFSTKFVAWVICIFTINFGFRSCWRSLLLSSCHILEFNLLSSLEPTGSVRHQICRKSRYKRIFRGPMLDLLPSEVMSTQLLTGLRYLVILKSDELGIKRSCLFRNGTRYCRMRSLGFPKTLKAVKPS